MLRIRGEDRDTRPLGVEIVAKKAGRPKAEFKRTTIVALKGVPEYKTWLDEFARHSGLSIADTIGMALQDAAQAKGFRMPPKR